VVNVSEGRHGAVLDELGASCRDVLLDVHRDPGHHRAVLTLGGHARDVEAAVRRLARTVVDLIDLTGHEGAHPRLGALDVVPFVELDGRGSPLTGVVGPAAVGARDRFARWAGADLSLPCFCYGPRAHPSPTGDGRPFPPLPEIRRRAFVSLTPDTGPPEPHPTAGACAVGARGPLVAYNVWVGGGDVALARSVAAAVRGPAVRSLGLDVGGRPQVSCNLIAPWVVGPAAVYDDIARHLETAGASAEGAELVGLVPAGVLDAVPDRRLAELGLGEAGTIEARVAARAR
jgi:glutamate formiminotransferase